MTGGSEARLKSTKIKLIVLKIFDFKPIKSQLNVLFMMSHCFRHQFRKFCCFFITSTIVSRYDPNYICNSFDDVGRYGYREQPEVCYWNLKKLAESFRVKLQLHHLVLVHSIKFVLVGYSFR